MDPVTRIPLAGLAAGLAALTGTAAQAAAQGEIGATSSGSIAISLSVAPRVRIGGLSDVSFVQVSPEDDAISAQNVCIWSNTATRGYSVTASGSGPGNAFTLASGALATRYGVAWNGAAGRASGARLDPGAPLAGQASSALTPDCGASGGASASLIVSIGTDDLQAAQPEASYLGTLNLLIAPE